MLLFTPKKLSSKESSLFLSFLHAAFTNVCSYSSYHRFLFYTISRMLHLLTDNCIFITISVKWTLEITICHQTDIFIFIHIDIAHITFVIFVVCIISAAFATILSHYNSPFLNLIIEFLHYCIIFFIMICFPSIIAYFLVLYEKKSINIAITGCPRFVIHAIFYVIFLSK